MNDYVSESESCGFVGCVWTQDQHSTTMTCSDKRWQQSSEILFPVLAKVLSSLLSHSSPVLCPVMGTMGTLVGCENYKFRLYF